MRRASSPWSACRPRPTETQASGIVGARIVERSHGWGSHVIEFFAIGTAVVPVSDEHVIEKPATGAAADRLTPRHPHDAPGYFQATPR